MNSPMIDVINRKKESAIALSVRNFQKSEGALRTSKFSEIEIIDDVCSISNS